ncbi:MAG: glutamate racemase [Defluviitaleaceae bacterium]|nr:glutamate racemase [Defluviitaleaceae bacterium]
MDARPIGIFDTGVGGLTVVSEVMKALPGEDIIYFGDTARVPYGSKSKETITKFSLQIVNFLLSRGVKAMIVACNTISSNSYGELVKAADVPIMEVVRPGVAACAKATRSKVVGVIGTEATVRSGLYEKYLLESMPGARVYSKACPLFVPLVEEGWTDNQVARATAEIYLGELLDKGIDSLLLGCTHYPVLINCIKEVAGEGVTVVNPAEAVAADMKKLLRENGLESGRERADGHTFFVSDNTPKFERTCENVLGRRYGAVKVDIESENCECPCCS